MKSLLIFVTLVLVSLAQNQTCINTTEYMNFYTCYVQYQSCDNGDNKTFQMISCLDTFCAQTYFYTVMVGKTPVAMTGCRRYQNRSLDQEQCTQTCCGTPFYTKFSPQTLYVCNQTNRLKSQQRSLATIIVVSVFGGICLIVVLIALTSYCCVLFLLFQFRCKRSAVSGQPNQQQQNQISLSNMNSGQIQKQLILQWKDMEKILTQSKHQKCSICLEDKINCLTSCNHQFHIQCLKKWLEGHQTCPICVNREIKPFRVICEKCGKKQATYDMKLEKAQEPVSLNKMLILKNSKQLQFVCKQCILV